MTDASTVGKTGKSFITTLSDDAFHIPQTRLSTSPTSYHPSKLGPLFLHSSLTFETDIARQIVQSLPSLDSASIVDRRGKPHGASSVSFFLASSIPLLILRVVTVRMSVRNPKSPVAVLTAAKKAIQRLIAPTLLLLVNSLVTAVFATKLATVPPSVQLLHPSFARTVLRKVGISPSPQTFGISLLSSYARSLCR